MSSENLILENIGFTYPEYAGIPSGPVFTGLNVTLPGDGISMVLGKPQAGKTSLSRILAGLIPRHTGGKLEGRVLIPGIPSGMSMPPDMMEHVGIVFQDTDEQIIMTRCDYEAAFALESLGLPRHEMERRVADSFERLGLEGFASRNPSRLSGGEKKKLLLASLCAQNPKVWILDETLEELDLPARKEVLKILTERGVCGVVFSSRYALPLVRSFASVSLLTPTGMDGPFSPGDEETVLAAAERDGLLLNPSGKVFSLGPASGNPVLTAEGIRFSYPAESSFSLEVERFALHRGEIVSLVGRNGCGKSTLGKTLCGLLAPKTGRITLADSDGILKEAGRGELNRGVGYMFQNPDYQIFLPTVREELLYGHRNTRGLGDRVAEAVEIFSLGNPDAPPALLSYGMRKRLQAACYYLLKRPVYILDEADSGLSYRDFFDILERLASPDRGLVVITHDIDLARAISNRVLLMKNGRLVSEHERGDPARITDLEG